MPSLIVGSIPVRSLFLDTMVPHIDQHHVDLPPENSTDAKQHNSVPKYLELIYNAEEESHQPPSTISSRPLLIDNGGCGGGGGGGGGGGYEIPITDLILKKLDASTIHRSLDDGFAATGKTVL